MDWLALSSDVAGQFARQAEQKGLSLKVEVPARATVTSEGELIRLVLQTCPPTP